MLDYLLIEKISFILKVLPSPVITVFGKFLMNSYGQDFIVSISPNIWPETSDLILSWKLMK